MITKEERKIRLAHKNMLDRCYNPKNASYRHYGGRGISVCPEWIESRAAFVAWALKSGHSQELWLDRIDNDEGYSPDNCRWATIKEQLRNQRRSRIISFGGITQSISAWAEQLNIGADTLHRRISVYNMPLERALTPGSLKDAQTIHGTRSAYERGCRCIECKTVHAARMRLQRHRRRDRLNEKELRQ